MTLYKEYRYNEMWLWDLTIWFFYRKRCGNLIVRPDALALATPDTITSSIGALTTSFASDFNGTLALTSAFRAFGIAETFFFNVVPIDFACAFDDFFATGLTCLRSFTNWRAVALASFSSRSFAFLRAFATRKTLLSYLRFSFASFSTSFCS